MPPCAGCAAGCRRAPTRMPCWAPHFTTGCNGSTEPSGCSTSTICLARSTGSWRERTRRASPNCRPRSWRRRGRRAPRSTSRCPSTWSIGGTVVRGRIDAVFADADGATVVDWKTGRSAGHPGGQAPRRGSARRLPVGVGGAARRACRRRSARRSTTCGRGRSSSPSRCRSPTTWRPCWSYPPPRTCGRSSAPG